MSKGGEFFVWRLLLVICTALTAECSSDAASSYYVMVESTLMYIDTSTRYISATTSSSSSLLSTIIMTNTPSPTSNIEPPDMQEMESNAVVMSMRNITIQQWMQIENTFFSIIANECTRQCARNGIDCGTMNNVNYTSEDVIILPGYPIIVDDKLIVAFSVSLPEGAMLDEGQEASVINQDTLFNIAAAASAAITAQTGVEVHEVGRYTAPATAVDSPESQSNLALVLSLTLISAAIILSVAAGFGSFYIWKMAKKHKSLDLIKNTVTTEQVELMSYKAAAYNN